MTCERDRGAELHGNEQKLVREMRFIINNSPPADSFPYSLTCNSHWRVDRTGSNVVGLSLTDSAQFYSILYLAKCLQQTMMKSLIKTALLLICSLNHLTVFGNAECAKTLSVKLGKQFGFKVFSKTVGIMLYH